MDHQDCQFEDTGGRWTCLTCRFSTAKTSENPPRRNCKGKRATPQVVRVKLDENGKPIPRKCCGQ